MHLEGTRLTVFYILVEILRNAVQHSHDPAGTIVSAQLMDKTPEYEERPVIQVAVGDAGMGIMESLRTTHPEIEDPHQALVMAQQPWVSSRFFPGERGNMTNAGLGLFFISEMAKRTAGRFFLATRGGSILLKGDLDGNQHSIVSEDTGFQGTLAVFELPIGEIEDYDGLISVLQELAKERIPSLTRTRWFRYEPAPQGSFGIVVRHGAEDTAHAENLVRVSILPHVAKGVAIEFDFYGLKVCTQSYLHSLLFSALRAACRGGVPIYISNANPAVRSSIDFLESYALPEKCA